MALAGIQTGDVKELITKDNINLLSFHIVMLGERRKGWLTKYKKNART